MAPARIHGSTRPRGLPRGCAIDADRIQRPRRTLVGYSGDLIRDDIVSRHDSAPVRSSIILTFDDGSVGSNVGCASVARSMSSRPSGTRIPLDRRPVLTENPMTRVRAVPGSMSGGRGPPSTSSPSTAPRLGSSTSAAWCARASRRIRPAATRSRCATPRRAPRARQGD